jgi:hypothetical protein
VTSPGHFHRHDPASRDRATYRVKAISRAVAAGATATTAILIGLAFHETPNHVKSAVGPTASVSETPTTTPPSTTPPTSGGTGTGSTLSPPTTTPSVPTTTPTTSPHRVVSGQS